MRRRRAGVLTAAVLLALATAAGGLPAAIDGPASIVTVAGNGAPGSGPGTDGEPATLTAIDHPRGLAFAPGGGVLAAEPFRNTVRLVMASGVVERFAGTGVPGYSGDGGPARLAQLSGVHGVGRLPDGSVVLADTGNHRIRRVAADGTITTIAGTGVEGWSGDGGAATDARIAAPRGLAVTAGGGVLIADSSNHRVRLVRPDGVIVTVAGTGTSGFSGDGGPATSAQLSLPFGVAPVSDGGFLIADAANNRIRRVRSDGTIVTVAGTGAAASAGDGGQATDAAVFSPHAVAALPDGGFLVADTFGQRVRRVSAAGIITTLAGTGIAGFSGDGGAAAFAELDLPKALLVRPDASGVLVADAGNNRVREITADLRPPLDLTLDRRRLSTRAGRPAVLAYVLSEPATVRLAVLRGTRTVQRATVRGRQGRNRLGFGRSLRPGSYTLRLIAGTADGRTDRAVATLTVRR